MLKEVHRPGVDCYLSDHPYIAGQTTDEEDVEVRFDEPSHSWIMYVHGKFKRTWPGKEVGMIRSVERDDGTWESCSNGKLLAPSWAATQWESGASANAVGEETADAVLTASTPTFHATKRDIMDAIHPHELTPWLPSLLREAGAPVGLAELKRLEIGTRDPRPDSSVETYQALNFECRAAIYTNPIFIQ